MCYFVNLLSFLLNLGEVCWYFEGLNCCNGILIVGILLKERRMS